MASRDALSGAHLNQTHKFCSHESLDHYPKLRRYFLLLMTCFIASHLALNITTPMSLYTDIDSSAYALSYIFPCLTALFCFFSYSGFFSKYKSPKLANIRRFLNFTAAMLLVGYLALFNPQSTYTNITDSGPEGWANGNPALPAAFYILFIFSAVCSTFILKAVLVAFYYILTSVLYLKTDHPAFAWMLARNICGCLLVIALLGLFSKFRWETFLKFLDLEEWNKVYRDILDRNPSCIAVIDNTGNVVYSNPGFQEMAHNNPEAFFQSVTNLRCRDLNNSFNLQQLFNFNANLLSPGRSPLTPISSEESLMKQRHSVISNKRGTGFSRLSTKARMNTMHSFGNLWQLLCHYRVCMDRETLEKDAQLVFDGKGAGKLPIVEHAKPKDSGKELFGISERETRRATINTPMNSYEIIIRPCPEYKKLIVILNNTTERDLIVGLENNSEFKDKVLASVSHELRTPLNGNLGYLQAALNDRKVQDRVKSKFLMPAFRSGRLLLHVIDDILDYSQLQTKGLKLKVEAKSLAETLNYCYELLEHSFKSKGLKLRIKLSDDLPKLFRTDHKRLKQIILNLLTNAIKFTMQGGVTIKASCLADSRVEIKVEDTGLGIKQQSIQKLFGEALFNHGLGFKEVNNSKGAGLGLKISQKLAELLSDDIGNEMPIQVQSVYGKGSCFNFTIKELAEDDLSDDSFATHYKDKDHIQEEQHISMGSLIGSGLSQGEVPLEHLNEDETILHEPPKNFFKIKKPLYIDSSIGSPFERRRTIGIGTERGFMPQKVLIVDDDPLNILVLESFIGQFGLLKDSANNGKEALEKVMNCPDGYQLILMDCQMPVMDGFEATELLNKKMEEGEIPIIPIIGCTAFSGADKLKQCLKSGMKEVLPKPVMKEQIGDVLKRYLGIGAN